MVLAIADNRLARPEDAKSALLEAIEAYGRSNELLGRAEASDALGIVLSWQGQLEPAGLRFSLALGDWARLGNKEGLARTVANLGRLNLEARRFRYALDFFRCSLALLDDSENVREMTRIQRNLGQALAGLERHDEALEVFASALERARSQGFRYLAFVCALESARSRMRLGDFQGAADGLRAAEQSLSPKSGSYERLSLLAAEGELLVARRDPRAVEVLEQTLKEHVERDLAGSEIVTRQLLADAMMEKGLKRSAEKHLTIAHRKAKARGLRRHAMEIRESMGRLDLVESTIEEDNQPVVEEMRGIDRGYVIRERLGRGSLGTVYRVFDIERGQDVALKRLNIRESYDQAERMKALESARTELEAASRVRHPGVARVLAVSLGEDGEPYVVQELIEGEVFHRYMKARRNPSLAETVPMMRKLALALAALQDMDVVHRDLKPRNIIVRDGDQPVLIDFGIAQLPGRESQPRNIRGTLAYMAPEQASGGAVDARADLYALAAIVYEWLAGRKPIEIPRGDLATSLQNIRKVRAESIGHWRPDLTRVLTALIDGSLRKQRWRRPDSAAEVVQELDRVADES